MKILIAYYSKRGRTGRLAAEIQKRLLKEGHETFLERIKVQKEKSSLAWFAIRFLKKKTDLLPAQTKDISRYDAVCLGSPDWMGISPPVASYIKELKGLKNRKIAIFGPTRLFAGNLFSFSSFFFDSSFCKAVERKGGRIAGRLFLSGKLDEKQLASDSVQSSIKIFCDKLENPTPSFKEYFLQKREIESARLFLLLFLVLIAGSALLQAISHLFGAPIFPWAEYASILSSSLLSSFVLLAALSYRKSFYFTKYFSVFSFVLLFTMTVFFFSPDLNNSIIIEYIVLFTLFSFFRDTKIIIFAGAMSFLSYDILLFFNRVSSPFFDLPVMALSLVIITYITKNLQESHIRALEAQDEAEMAQSSLEIKIRARTRELLILSQKLEEEVEKRTDELKVKIAELERFNRLAVGRELKMIELKAKIRELEKNA